MYELKKYGNICASKFVGNGPSSYEKGIYRAAVSQRLRNTGLWLILAWYMFFFLASPIRCRCPGHIRRCILINMPILTSLHNFLSQSLFLIRYCSSPSTCPKSFLHVFLSRIAFWGYNFVEELVLYPKICVALRNEFQCRFPYLSSESTELCIRAGNPVQFHHGQTHITSDLFSTSYQSQSFCTVLEKKHQSRLLVKESHAPWDEYPLGQIQQRNTG